MTLTNEQKQDLRHAALAALVYRAPAALSARQLFNAVKKELPFLFEEADLLAAFSFLAEENPPKIKMMFDGLGGTRYWAAQPAGILFVERQ